MTANSAAFVCTEILTNSGVLAWLEAALLEVLPARAYTPLKTMEYVKVEQCRYLRWCIKEGLRRHALAPGLALRVVPEGCCMVGGFDVPGKVHTCIFLGAAVY